MLQHAPIVQHRHHIPPQRMSVAKVLQAYRTILREYKSEPDSGEALDELLTIAVTDDYTRTNKRSRHHPRKKVHEQTRITTIVNANKSQVQRTQLLHAASGGHLEHVGIRTRVNRGLRRLTPTTNANRMPP